MLHHKHLIVNAAGLATPLGTPEAVERWLRELVELVAMKRLIGPHAVRCDVLDNEGVTGFVCIETSHASIHIWDRTAVPYLRFDLYSCTDFAVDAVLAHLQEFGPERCGFVVLDRNHETAIGILDQGERA